MPSSSARACRALWYDGERVSLAAGAIEREHQVAPQALPKRVLRDETFELRDELDVASQREICLDPSLDGDEAKLLEADDRRLGERLVGEVVQRRACARARAPRAASSEADSGIPLPRRRSTRLLGQTLEAGEIELIGTDVDPVAGLGAENRLGSPC